MEIINDFLKTCKSLYESNNFLDKLIGLCNLYDLNMNYEKTLEGEITRIILRIKKINKVHPLFYYYCNGLVIDTTWKVLAVPPIAFNKKYISSDINIKKYDVLKVIDGTVVTIYHWQNKWHISSCNGYDVSTFYWMGDKTYSEVIYDLIEKLYPNIIEELGISIIKDRLNFDNLDKNYCYTIGFRHHNFQPLILDPECIWNIQKTNRDTLDIVFNEGINGLPKQQIINYSMNVEEIMNINKLALTNAMKPDPTFNYGFILRSSDIELTKEFSNILITSPLLKKIKKNIYDYPATITKQYITNLNRLDYITIKNYFNKIERNDILQLYPQFLQSYNLYNKCIKEVIQCIIIILKNKKMENKDPLTMSVSIITLSHSLLKHISKYDVLDPFHPDIESIIRDYITNPEYSVLFLNTINKFK
jgi:hypothetical protein